MSESLKSRQKATKMMDAIRAVSPGLASSVIDERDGEMVRHMKCVKGSAIAVVGLAHMDGIIKLWVNEKQ